MDIPLSEVKEKKVLQENIHVAKVDPNKKNLKYENIQKGKVLVKISRQIDGLPV